MAERDETQTRGRISRALQRPWQRLALAFLLGLVGLGSCADTLASELPVALYFHQNVYLLPGVTQPAELRAYDNPRIARELSAHEWAVFPPVPWGQNSHDLDAILAPPSARHWFGTDSSGRDVLARSLHGARVSLLVSVLSVLLLSSIGCTLGLLAGYGGGLCDALIMRLVDVLHAVPTLLLLVTLLSLLHPSGFGAVLAMLTVIGVTRWTDLARLVRAEALRARASPYMEAAQALGLGPLRIMLRHLLPNVLSPVLVAASFSMAGAIVIEGALSFLGFGMPADVASWGALLNDAREHVDAWWLAVFPGALLFLTVSAYNILGEGVRDAIDPTLQI